MNSIDFLNTVLLHCLLAEVKTSLIKSITIDFFFPLTTDLNVSAPATQSKSF